jgi:predicted metal-dependent HD superfamily phosphohydrolase
MFLHRWKVLMDYLGLPESQDTFSALIAAYSEKHRIYHGLSHLEAVLVCLEKVESLAEQKCLVELALWFHDAIYQPFSKENEKRSAKWACDFLKENRVSQQVIATVYDLIMATCHAGQPASNDQKLIVDIDLSILGQAESVYKKYAVAVRKEYSQVPRLIYRRKRKVLLRDFLSRERIYHFDDFYREYELQARKNLMKEMNSLS